MKFTRSLFFAVLFIACLQGCNTVDKYKDDIENDVEDRDHNENVMEYGWEDRIGNTISIDG